MGAAEALCQIRHLDVGGAEVANLDLDRLVSACTSATTIAFRAGSSDQARTGVLKNIRTSMRERLHVAGGQSVRITLSNWASRLNSPAMSEYLKLQKLASMSKRDTLIFASN